MGLAAFALSVFLLDAIWACIHHASGWINPDYPNIFDTRDALDTIFFLCRLRFAPGLLACLRSATPPTIAWFKSPPAHVPAHSWGVYVVLEKAGYIPLIYVGSGTAWLYGVRRRFQDYKAKRTLPLYVEKALDAGYEITHFRLLVTCPKPFTGVLSVYRTLIITLEAVFTVLFSALRNRSKSYSFPDICP